jgi:zinc transport system substrate-binding protein
VTGWLGATIAAALVLGACDQGPSPTAPLTVAATVYPLFEFTRRVAGSNAEVVALVPAGVEPHDWEPSAGDVSRIRKARLLVYNGVGLDPWVEKLGDGGGRDGRPVLVRATEGLALLPAAAGEAGARGGTASDPHVWLDPVLAQAMVETIRAALARVDTAHAAAYADNARAFTGELAALDRDFAAGLAACARRDIVTSHAAWTYLAARYRLTALAVMGVAPESEPSPARLASIARVAREKKVKYIFVETLASPRLAETLAREIGAETLVLNPIEGLTPEEAAAGKGYLSVMEGNLRTLRRGLDCR